MTIEKTAIEGLLVLSPDVHGDERGYFMESYNKKDFEKDGLFYDFVQDNESLSSKGVLRGLHFQKKHPQAKLVRVVQGEVFDVAVDLRKDSPTYGKWHGVLLSDSNKKMFLIPRGFAHGFLVLSEKAKFVYKCDDFYHPEDEGGIRYDDKDINVQWPEVEGLLLSKKDQNHPTLKECPIAFEVEKR